MELASTTRGTKCQNTNLQLPRHPLMYCRIGSAQKCLRVGIGCAMGLAARGASGSQTRDGLGGDDRLEEEGRLLLGGHPAVVDVSLLELAGEEEAALVEEGERDDRLDDANALSPEDARKAEGSHVRANLLERRGEADAAALDRVGLHDHLEARERVGDDHVDRADDGRRDQVGDRRAEESAAADLLL